MDCAEIRDALLAGTSPSGPGVEAHVRDCEACGELLSERGTLGRALSQSETPSPFESALLWSALERSVAKEKGPRAWMRSRSTPVRVAAAAVVAALVVFVGGRPAPGATIDAPVPWLVVFALAGVACIAILVAPLGRPRPPSSVRMSLVVSAVALPLGYALGASNAAASGASSDFAIQAFGCFAYGTLLALPFLLVVLSLDRSERPSSSLLVGFGGAAGLVANVALGLHCPNTELGHLALGHASIGGMLAVLGVGLWALYSGPARGP
jgi:hypothetical protein